MHSFSYRLSLIVILSLGLISFTTYAAPKKPQVAIKFAKIGEKISKGAQRQLNLESLLASMEKSLVSTRKFDVLTRSQLQAIREEQKFDQSKLTKGGTAREGELATANFLVLPTVQDFVFYRSTKPVPNLAGKYTRQDSGRLEVAAQIIDTTTGGIKATFYMKSRFGTAKKVVNTKGGSPSNIYYTKMADDIGAKMATQLIALVFPMKVLNVQASQVFINRGQDGGLSNGESLNVYRPGVALIDPDTGENLGSAETYIGQIKVTRINPKFTIAEIEAKSLTEPVQKGDIVRKP